GDASADTTGDASADDDYVRIDNATGLVRVAAGVRLGVLYTELAERGLVIPGGICSSVAVSGLALGGGLGYLVRRYGYTADAVVSATLVLADGSVLTVSDDDNATAPDSSLFPSSGMRDSRTLNALIMRALR